MYIPRVRSTNNRVGFDATLRPWRSCKGQFGSCRRWGKGGKGQGKLMAVQKEV